MLKSSASRPSLDREKWFELSSKLVLAVPPEDFPTSKEDTKSFSAAKQLVLATEDEAGSWNWQKHWKNPVLQIGFQEYYLHWRFDLISDNFKTQNNEFNYSYKIDQK